MLSDDYLLTLVEAGKSLKTIRMATGYGPRFILNRLKKLGVVPKDTRMSQMQNTFKSKKIFDIYTLDHFVKYRIKEKKSLEDVIEILGVEDDKVEFIINADKRYQEQRSKIPV